MRKGYTLIEVMTVMAIAAILFTISTLSLNNVQQNTYQDTSVDILVSDIRLQQLKSMSGDTNFTGTTEPHGIHFGSESYTLFQGDTFSPTDTANFEVSLNPNVTFSSVLFPQSQIIFTEGSGEISGFTNGNNTITLTNSISGENTTITINKLGAITQIE